MQLIFNPLLSETDEVNRCERFPLTPCEKTFQNKESIHYNTLNCRAKVGGPDSGLAWYFEANARVEKSTLEMREKS